MIIKFNKSLYNLVKSYTFAAWILEHEGKMYVVSGLCPHKKGPLYYGKYFDFLVVCPWHSTKVSCKTLIRNAYPSIFVGEQVTTIVPISSSTKIVKKMVNNAKHPEEERT